MNLATRGVCRTAGVQRQKRCRGTSRLPGEMLQPRPSLLVLASQHQAGLLSARAPAPHPAPRGLCQQRQKRPSRRTARQSGTRGCGAGRQGAPPADACPKQKDPRSEAERNRRLPGTRRPAVLPAGTAPNLRRSRCRRRRALPDRHQEGRVNKHRPLPEIPACHRVPGKNRTRPQARLLPQCHRDTAARPSPGRAAGEARGLLAGPAAPSGSRVPAERRSTREHVLVPFRGPLPGKPSPREHGRCRDGQDSAAPSGNGPAAPARAPG